MKSAPILLMATLACATGARANEPAIAPTAPESFLAQGGVAIEWERRIGTLESGDARAELFAWLARDGADPDTRMRGARLRLTHNAGIEEIQLDDAEIAALRREMDELTRGMPELESGRDAPWRVQGTARCWMPPEPRRILCPSYRIGPEGAALTLGILGGAGFSFPGRVPSDFASLMDAVVAALDAKTASGSD